MKRMIKIKNVDYICLTDMVKGQEGEADMLNLALWSCTAKQWRDVNPEYAKKGLNIRDTASINELVVLANLESFNAELLKYK